MAVKPRSIFSFLSVYTCANFLCHNCACTAQLQCLYSSTSHPPLLKCLLSTTERQCGAFCEGESQARPSAGNSCANAPASKLTCATSCVSRTNYADRESKKFQSIIEMSRHELIHDMPLTSSYAGAIQSACGFMCGCPADPCCPWDCISFIQAQSSDT